MKPKSLALLIGTILVAIAAVVIFINKTIYGYVALALIFAALFYPRVHLYSEFNKMVEENYKPTTTDYLLSYIAGFKLCAFKCNINLFSVSYIVSTVPLAFLFQLFCMNGIQNKMIAIVVAALLTALLLIPALIIIVRYLGDLQVTLAPMIAIVLSLITLVVAIVIPWQARVIVTYNMLYITLGLSLLMREVDVFNIQKELQFVSMAAYIPIIGGSVLANKMRSISYDNSRYAL